MKSAVMYFHEPGADATIGKYSVMVVTMAAALAFATGCASKRPEEQREGKAQAEPTAVATDKPATGTAPAGSPDGQGDHGPVTTELFDPPAELARALTLRQVATGLERPVGLEHIPGDTSGRLFVVEQHVARIRIARPRSQGGRDGLEIASAPFFDLRGQVATRNEQGLLGLVFHPKFAENKRLYVNYTAVDGTTRVVEYRVDDKDPDRVDMASARTVFEIGQPYSNHNAGDLEFGPDGKLYIGTGDGGAAGDPLEAGQNRKIMLAKMLRVDVDSESGDLEVVHIGLRNPWRYHFDVATGDLYIADVGQNKYEFVYAVAADNIDGHNFGWNVVEGSHCYQSRNCDTSGFTPPIVEYDHDVGCSITGGVVYRGKAIAELVGAYFYADYCTSIIRSLRWSKDGVRQHWRWRKALDPDGRVREISSFGTDAAGELYVVSLQGQIFKLARQ